MTKTTLVMLFIPTIVSAGPISSGTFNNFQPEFWNNSSWDGPNLNIGQIHPNNPYLNNQGQPVPFSFQHAVSYELIGEISSYQNLNAFGWFEIGSPFWGYIFNPLDMPGHIVSSVTTHLNVGYFITGPGGFYNTIDNPEHFALFKETDWSFILGIEDLPFSHTDADYNDLQVRIKQDKNIPPSVPEPSSLILLGSGLFMIARRFKSA